MNYFSSITFILLLIFTTLSEAQTVNPKSEFRAVWVATVVNLDWPSSRNLSTAQQKSELITMLDELKELNFNAVVFQVRSVCDAMYNSAYEPWSYFLTGTQGTPPSPYYDPLAFAIEEAHKRGIELHAWFNPYRADHSIGSYTLHPSHIAVEHPEWTIVKDDYRYLDPGFPFVRDYVTNVVMDVVRNYDVDGIHFDDYFYPYGGITSEDDTTFAQYPRGFTNKNDWRRDNINRLVAQVQDSIKAVKPSVRFGISPFGIWKSGTPPGIVGLSSYSAIYCDPIAWMQEGTIDYLTPQCYWPFGGGQDYGKLVPWWADSTSANGIQLYPGQAAYRINSWGDASEMPNQVRLNRSNPHIDGSVFFRTYVGILDNQLGFEDSLRSNFYNTVAIPPHMPYLSDVTPPNAPQNVRYESVGGVDMLLWDAPSAASDGDTAKKYLVYRFTTDNPQSADLENAENIAVLTGGTMTVLPIDTRIGTKYIFVTALDDNNNESTLSNYITLEPPEAPDQIEPAEGEDVGDLFNFIWGSVDNAASYFLQVGKNSNFQTDLVIEEAGLIDTVFEAGGLDGDEVYYWRVLAENEAGRSVPDGFRSFHTAFPPPPLLISPGHQATGISVDTLLTWQSAANSDSYTLHFSANPTFSFLLIDSSGITGTEYVIEGLGHNKTYYWRVSAENSYGSSGFDSYFLFTTKPVVSVEDNEIPSDYQLEQNYPNPFNPSTNIRFAIPEAAFVQLKIFDIFGTEVITLVDDTMSPGIFSVSWNAVNKSGQRVSSGIYFYTLKTNDYLQTRKMMLLK